MKTFITTAGLCLALIAAGNVSSADEHELMPIPAAPGTVYSAPPTVYAPAPMDEQMYDVPVADHIMYDSAPAVLYTNVKYKDNRKKAPCAVTKIIRVKDPCDSGCDGCCGQRYVFIQICVPPCACERIRCRRDGDRVRYDYGKYAVDVRIKRNHIVVDYKK